MVDQISELTGSSDSDPCRILILEDMPLLARHYAALLGTAGMKVEVLNRPDSLLEILERFRPELILLDLYMPECSGIEVARVIRQDTRNDNIPIVYLSTDRCPRSPVGCPWRGRG